MSSREQESMRHWRLSTLLAYSGVRVLGRSVDSDPDISSLTDDSRNVLPGTCFVAVRGARSNGHLYVESACNAGAAAVVVDEPVSVPPGTAVVQVEDTRAALATLAAAYYELFPAQSSCLPPRIIGVTGTNGKTTVAWLLRSILTSAGHKTAMLGTVEYDLAGETREAALTTPGAIDLCRLLRRATDRGADYAVLEVSSHALDQRRTDGLLFSAAVLTNLSGDHLDYHETMEGYSAAKQRLFSRLSPDACAIVNADDPRAPEFLDCTIARTVRYGLGELALDVTCDIDSLGLTATNIRLRGRTCRTDARSSLIGRHNVLNILAAAATAEALGIGAEAIRLGIETLRSIPGRLQRVTEDDHPYTVLVDYAHTDDALANVLSTLRPLTQGRLITVFGCGGDRDRAKRPRMAAAAQRYSDMAVVTSDNPRTELPYGIIDDIVLGFGGSSTCEVVIEEDRRAAIAYAVQAAEPGDTVLVAGKGHETYQLVGGQILPFDDCKVVRSILEAGELHAATVSTGLAAEGVA